MIVGILMVVFLVGVIGSATGNPYVGYSIGALAMIGGFIPKAKGVAFDDVSPDFSKLAAYAGKNRKELYRKLIYGMKIAQDITLVPNVKKAINLYKLTINNGPKPYTGDFESEGDDIQFSGRTLDTEAFQRDVLIDPHKYRLQFMGEERGPGEGANNQKIPFAQFTMEAIAQENGDALNLQTAWNGVGQSGFTAYNSGTAYTGGEYISFVASNKTKYYRVATGGTTAGQSPVTHPDKFVAADALAIAVGLGTKLRAGRTADDIKRVVSTGSLLTDTLNKLRQVFRALPEPQRVEKVNNMFISQTVFEAALDDYVEVAKYTDKDTGLIYLPGTNKKCILSPASWMTGSQMSWCTTKNNAMMATDLLSDLESFKVLPRMYKLELGLKGVIGFNYQDGDAISMNDQN